MNKINKLKHSDEFWDELESRMLSISRQDEIDRFIESILPISSPEATKALKEILKQREQHRDRD